MTISSTNNRMDYTGNGATSTYSYTFKIFSKTELLVTHRDTDGVEATLTVDVDYTVTGAGDAGGGSINLLGGNLPTGYKLTIRRVRPLKQETDIRNQGDFYPEIHEDALDHQIMVDQQQQDEIDRSLKLPETESAASATLPAPVALKLLRWNAAGAALELVDAADISSAVTAVDASLTLAAGNLSVTRPLLIGTGGGTVDAITATVSPAPASLTNGLRVLIEASGKNTSATPTFNLNSLGAKTIVRGPDWPLAVGDIPGANWWMDLVYDASLDKWVLLNPVNLPHFTTAQRDALTPWTGLVIFNTTLSRPQIYLGSWLTLVDTNSADSLANKTLLSALLTTPKIATGGYIQESGGSKLLEFLKTTTPVNWMRLENADTGAGPRFSAQGTDADVDIQLEPKGSGLIKGPRLGAWDATKVKDTVYQAATDLRVHVYFSTPGTGNHRVEGLTDGSNPPTTVVSRVERSGITNGVECFAFSVKKGDYWKVSDVTTGATVTINIIPEG